LKLKYWTALRPEATTGFGLGNPMNLGKLHLPELLEPFP